MSKQIEVKMIDDFTGKEVVRHIDISNFTVGISGDGFGSSDYQKRTLETWISTRANEQHNTSLSLVSWAIR